jgi:tRNA-uridine 2-sulfurtransferase
VVIDVRDYPSPIGLLPDGADERTVRFAASICIGYSKAPKTAPVDVVVKQPGGDQVIQAIGLPPDDVRKLMI